MTQEIRPEARVAAAADLEIAFEQWVAENPHERERPENSLVLNQLGAARDGEKNLDADNQLRTAANTMIRLGIIKQEGFDALLAT